MARASHVAALALALALLGGCERYLAVRFCEVDAVTPAALTVGEATTVTVSLTCAQVISAGPFGLAAATDGEPVGPIAIEVGRELPGLVVRFELPADALTATGGAAVVVVRDDEDDADAWFPIATVTWPMMTARAP